MIARSPKKGSIQPSTGQMVSTNSNKDSASDDLIDYSDDETAGEHSEAGNLLYLSKTTAS